MPQQFLHGTQVAAGFEQMTGEGVAQAVRVQMLGQAAFFRLRHQPELHATLAEAPALPRHDPVWSQLREEAEAMVRCEPALASFAYETVLNHDRLEEAVVHRLADRLGHVVVSPSLIRQTYLEALQDSRALAEAFRVDLEALQVDWEVESASVVTRHLPEDIEQRLGKRTVTTGCGQGTVFGNLLERQSLAALDAGPFSQALLYRLLEALAAHNATYRKAGAVHGCALCRDDEVLAFIEDVGRHNAVDTLAGLSWLAPLSDDASDYQGANIFYTTGRLTSEMVLKVAQAGISVLVSRSGVTQKGVELAERFGVLLIARAKGRHFQAVDPAGRLVLDAIPPLRAGDALKSSRHDASGKPSSADGAAGHDKGAQ